MRALPLLLLLLFAAGAGVLVAVARRPPPSPPPPAPPAAPPSSEPSPAAEAPRMEPWRTTATLAEELRDALGDPEADLLAVFREVSELLRPHAAYTLEKVAAAERSPRVRALLVLAAGIHVPSEPLLARFASDREEAVRRAAALAREGSGAAEVAAFVVSFRR